MSVDYASYRGRTILTLTLDLASPMHVGSGFDDPGADGDGEIATVVVDVCGKPYVPPTTIKGALRALAGAAIRSAPVDDMFGAPLMDDKRSAARARPGWIVFSGAHCVRDAAVGQRLDGGEGAKAGLLIARRSAINSACGVAASNKLFRSEMVAPGAQFETRLTILRDRIDFTDPAIVALIELLALWKSRGIAIGRSKGDGYGLLRLAGIASVARVAIAAGKVETSVAAGAWLERIQTTEKTLDASAGRAEVFRLTLRSDLPFAVLGAKPRQTRDASGKLRSNVLAALRDASGAPDLPASTLMGVLRQRAAWFARLRALRQGLRGDDAENDVAGRIERLFGSDAPTVKADRRRGAKMTGFAGVLKLHSIVASKAQPQTFHSVKVDRFSLGPFEGGLFAIEAFAKPKFSVELYLDRRATPQDRDFARCFFAWLCSASPAGGLTLGHAGNRGFGWFDVAEEGASA